jgi:hypothetical protein
MHTLPLAETDRAVLGQRSQFLWQLTRWLYLALAVGLGIYLLTLFITGRSDLSADVVAALVFSSWIGGTVALTHAMLALWERKAQAVVRDDLHQGVKICIAGTLEKVEEGGESDATWLWLRVSGSEEAEAFPLRTIADLHRIDRKGLEGKEVVIEYAPTSRIVLNLRSLDATTDPARSPP